MKERLTTFDLVLPGIVAGMVLGGVVLRLARDIFPAQAGTLVPRQSLLILAAAIITASVVGISSLLLPPKSGENTSRKSSSGGTNVR